MDKTQHEIETIKKELRTIRRRIDVSDADDLYTELLDHKQQIDALSQLVLELRHENDGLKRINSVLTDKVSRQPQPQPTSAVTVQKDPEPTGDGNLHVAMFIAVALSLAIAFMLMAVIPS